jgi:hypothetical protein
MIMRCLFIISIISISGCYGYKELPLREQVATVEKVQDIEIQTTKLLSNGTIDETNAIRLALAFNPDIRIPLIHDRGFGENEVQFRGVARPELQVTKDSSTVGLNVDMFSLYNLLSYTERQAWREMRRAERTQVFSEQSGAVIRLTRDVRLAFLELARLAKQDEILNNELLALLQYKIKIEKKIDNVSAIALSLAEAELREKIDKVKGELTNAELVITSLVGTEPEKKLKFDTKDTLSVTIMPEIKTIREMSKSASENNWKLISLSSQYIRKEYDLRQAYLRCWGQISIGPSLTFIPGDTSVGVSVRVRIPWPSHSEDNIKDTTDERALIAARYTDTLHDLQSDIMKQYNEMQVKWDSLKNPRISVNWLGNILDAERNNMDIHIYLDLQTRIFNQELHQLDEVAKYKMSGILLDSLLK